MKAMFDALNVAYGEEEKRGFIALNLLSLAFTLGMILFVLVAIGAIVGGSQLDAAQVQRQWPGRS